MSCFMSELSFFHYNFLFLLLELNVGRGCVWTWCFQILQSFAYTRLINREECQIKPAELTAEDALYFLILSDSVSTYQFIRARKDMSSSGHNKMILPLVCDMYTLQKIKNRTQISKTVHTRKTARDMSYTAAILKKLAPPSNCQNQWTRHSHASYFSTTLHSRFLVVKPTVKIAVTFLKNLNSLNRYYITCELNSILPHVRFRAADPDWLRVCHWMNSLLPAITSDLEYVSVHVFCCCIKFHFLTAKDI